SVLERSTVARQRPSRAPWRRGCGILGAWALRPRRLRPGRLACLARRGPCALARGSDLRPPRPLLALGARGRRALGGAPRSPRARGPARRAAPLVPALIHAAAPQPSRSRAGRPVPVGRLVPHA